jgi:glycosyltransferase involved in cell wall biosynthesis
MSLRYVLLTAARNEAAYIEHTLRSVTAQTVAPERWIIVSDGSTDATDEIVGRYAKRFSWIELVRRAERKERSFAGKAEAINAAYAQLAGVAFEVVGNLDADISFAPDFMAFLLARFADDPALGVAGTPYVEQDGASATHSAHGFSNREHVSGQCQLFRRACFDAVGGYLPIKGGAVDWIAVTTARMRGWKTRSFSERQFFHHRKMGTAASGPLAARFHYGRKAYYVGGHPAWELLRGVFSMRDRPWILGGLMFQLGYLWAALTRVHRPVSPELIAFHRSEQMRRLRSLLHIPAGRAEGRS